MITLNADHLPSPKHTWKCPNAQPPFLQLRVRVKVGVTESQQHRSQMELGNGWGDTELNGAVKKFGLSQLVKWL